MIPNRPHHSIQKQMIGITFENRDYPAGLPDRIAQNFYQHIQPRMEVLFDDLFGTTYYASIDRMEIDCGILDENNWEQELTEVFLRLLEEKLKKTVKKDTLSGKPPGAVAQEGFLYYLRNGFLPWNCDFQSVAELEREIRLDRNLVISLKKLIAADHKAADRLILQFSTSFTDRIIDTFTGEKQNVLIRIVALMKESHLSIRENPEVRFYQVRKPGQPGLSLHEISDLEVDNKAYDAAILNLLASDDTEYPEKRFLFFLLRRIDGNQILTEKITGMLRSLGKDRGISSGESPGNFKDSGAGNFPWKGEEKKTGREVKHEGKLEVSHGIPEEEQRSVVPAEPIYLSNAGLVLLHPFLPALFETLGLFGQKGWTEPAASRKAVLVSEFLVRGVDEQEEFNLVLNKILCGLNPEEVVDTKILLEEETKEECDQLLRDAILHWGVLKNTSVEGLREAFLRRKGKLTKVDHGWLLQVEQHTVDVLINHLPWGIGMVKLPWMEEILFTEWI